MSPWCGIKGEEFQFLLSAFEKSMTDELFTENQSGAVAATVKKNCNEKETNQDRNGAPSSTSHRELPRGQTRTEEEE